MYLNFQVEYKPRIGRRQQPILSFLRPANLIREIPIFSIKGRKEK
jgi:hypothetical protein